MYVLVHYQHPDDKNDTWASKGLVILALTVAEVSVLMFPMDVSNRQTCDAVLDLSQVPSESDQIRNREGAAAA